MSFRPRFRSLARDRVNHMRRVADQREPFADERARDEVAERKRARLALGAQLAEMQAETLLELAMKFVRRQRHDALGLVARLGPHQRRTLAGQRQDRERPRGQEMLLGAPQ